MNISIKGVISLIGAINGILLSFFIFSKNNNRANKFLALLILSLSVRIGKSFIKEFFYAPYWVRNIGLLGFIFIGVFLYFYIKTLYDQEMLFKNKHLFSLIFPIFFLISCFVFSPMNYYYMRIRYIAIILHLLIYLFLSLSFWIKNFRNEAISSQIDRNRSNWVRNLIIGIFLVWLSYFMNIFIAGIPYLLGPMLYSFMFYIMIFWLFNKKKMINVFQNDKKYKHSGLTKSEANKYLSRLKGIMINEKLYLEHDLNLQILSDRLSILPLYLSQIINENLKQNFSDFINTYRLVEVEKNLLSPDHKKKKIIDIAHISGFNSLSSFNSVFKKKHNISPSEFRQNNKL